jgi:hypothetical protein
MIASTRLKNRKVKFAVMAACGDWEIYKKVGIDLWGSILSIYDVNDDLAGTCSDFFTKSAGILKKREVVLHLGLGHGILYRPLKEWVDLELVAKLTFQVAMRDDGTSQQHERFMRGVACLLAHPQFPELVQP